MPELSASPRPARASRAVAVAVAVAALAAAVHGRALAAGFYSDDYTWLGRLPATLRSPGFVFIVIYRDFNPLFHLSLALDYLLAGPDPRLFHATSLLVHGAAAGLLVLLCHRGGAGLPAAAAAALTWGVNARLSEPAIWPAARGHSLATLFVLVALLALAAGRRASTEAGDPSACGLRCPPHPRPRPATYGRRSRASAEAGDPSACGLRCPPHPRPRPATYGRRSRASAEAGDPSACGLRCPPHPRPRPATYGPRSRASAEAGDPSACGLRCPPHPRPRPATYGPRSRASAEAGDPSACGLRCPPHPRPRPATYGPRSRAWACLAFLLALLCKETAFFPLLLLPFLPAVLAPAAPARLRERLQERRSLLPFALLGAAFLLFNLLAKPSLHYTAASPGALLLRLPFVLLRPLGLGDYYPFTASAAIAVGLGFAGLGWLLRGTLARFGLLWVLTCSLPVLPLDRLSSRHYYLISVGYGLVLCGLVEWGARRIAGTGPRRLAALLGATAVALVVATNALLVQREIDDYALMSRPYHDCLETLRQAARELAPGEGLVVADVSPRTAVAALTRAIDGRGNVRKLIPLRPDGIGGLVPLADAINIVRGGAGGQFAVPAPPVPPFSLVRYDGSRAVPVLGPLPQLPAERLFAVRLVPLADYLAAARGGGP